MIHPEVLLAVSAIVAIAAVTTRGRLNRIRDTRSSANADETVANLDGRIARLEQAVDTIAIEMERIGESQRFLTKLLADRPKAPKEVS